MKRLARARSLIVALAALLTAPVAPAEIQNLSLPPQPAGGPTTELPPMPLLAGDVWLLTVSSTSPDGTVAVESVTAASVNATFTSG